MLVCTRSLEVIAAGGVCGSDRGPKAGELRRH